MLQNIDLGKILFLDIETVSEKSNFKDLSDNFKTLWALKSRQFVKDHDDLDSVKRSYNEKAGIFSEFAKIVCISVGYLRNEGNQTIFRLKSFYGDDEVEILNDFSRLLNKNYNNPLSAFLCGHNIKEFDVPFLCRRMIINGLEIPDILQVSGKKPWEIKHFVDTLELWKFGDIKNYTSLNLLAAVLNVPSPKDDIDGSQVGKVYWEDRDLSRIAVYCQKDVQTCMQVLLRLQGLPILTEDQIETPA